MGPSVSVVYILNEVEEAAAADQVRADVAAYDGPAEIIAVYDASDTVRDRLAQSLEGVPVRCLYAPGRRYYEMKNDGAAVASGDVLVFVDADVTPKPGFLSALVEPLSEPEVVVASGVTYVGPLRTRLDRLYAAYWMFTAPDPPGPPFPYDRFWANGFAISRADWQRFGGFPDDDRSRGQCRSLAHLIFESGGVVLRAPDARFEHPPPRDEGFVGQGLRRGRDLYLSRSLGVVRWPDSGTHWLRSAQGYVRDVRERAEVLGLGPVERTLAVGLSVADMALMITGSTLARHAPRFAARFTK